MRKSLLHRLLRRRRPDLGMAYRPSELRPRVQNGQDAAFRAGSLIATRPSHNDDDEMITESVVGVTFWGSPLLAKLPSELLTAITAFTQVNGDLDTIRLSCKALRDAAWPIFAASFNTKLFHPVYSSIQSLLEFTEHSEILSPYLRTLHISLTSLNWDYGRISLAEWIEHAKEDWILTAEEGIRLQDSYALMWTQHRKYEDSAKLLGDLTRAMRNLVRIEKIVVVRMKPGRTPRWPAIPLDWDRRCQRLFDRAWMDGAEIYRTDTEDRVVGLLLAGLNRSGVQARLHCLHTDGRLVLPRLPAPPPHNHESSWKPMPVLKYFRHEFAESEAGRLLLPEPANLISLLHLAPNLTHLHITFPSVLRPRVDDTSRTVQVSNIPLLHPPWSMSLANSLLPTLRFPYLTHVHFSDLPIDPTALDFDFESQCKGFYNLTRFLLRHMSSLRNLELKNLLLPLSDWKALNNFLAEKLRLRYFELCTCEEINGRSSGRERDFAERFEWVKAAEVVKIDDVVQTAAGAGM